MSLSHTFIDRPIFATVISVFITLIGLGALLVLPVAQYPEIVPPTVQMTTIYPGASAEMFPKRLRLPLEQEINGVENMLYMSSQSTGDGKLTITVTFRIGTDLNVAQMLTQNRVPGPLPRLPEDVQRLGVKSANRHRTFLIAVHLYLAERLHAICSICLTTRRSISVICWRSSRVLATFNFQAAANMPCAYGSTLTRPPPVT